MAQPMMHLLIVDKIFSENPVQFTFNIYFVVLHGRKRNNDQTGRN